MLQLIANSCINPDGSYDKKLRKLFFSSASELVELNDDNKMNELSDKWSDFMIFPDNLLENALKDDMMLHVAGCGLKKIFKDDAIKCDCCKDKLTRGKGHDASGMEKEAMPCEKSFIETRDEGGLIWPSTNVVCVSGVVVIFLNRCFIPIN